ncbi:hypothetical protein OH77DRAFT_1366578, partial [Trametes cingulata]
EAWKQIDEYISQYIKNKIARWNKAIDNYPLYGAILAAIISAFTVLSYDQLKVTPPDPMLPALEQVSLQLSSLSVNPPFINSTHPAYQITDVTAPSVSRAAITLNALWFSSLILSLFSASIGIAVKVSLDALQSGLVFGRPREIARYSISQLHGIVKWHIGAVILAIPGLLLVALVLFI